MVPKKRTTERMPQVVFVFKVALTYQPNIWRRIAARGNHTLHDLHEAIFDAFDRYDEHLYSFFFPKLGSKGRPLKRGEIEYTSSEAADYDDELDEEFDEGGRDASRTKLASLGLKRKQVFRYLFDWGDEWRHTITVEQIDAEPEKGKYPRVLEKHGKSPPQYPDYDEDDEDDEEE
jgi:hypothetical protein